MRGTVPNARPLAATGSSCTALWRDWKEKVRLPVGPAETSDFWHMQQRFALAVYGAVVYVQGSHDKTPRLVRTYYIQITDIREQTAQAQAANLMLDKVLAKAGVSSHGVLHLWSDCGPHCRTGTLCEFVPAA